MVAWVVCHDAAACCPERGELHGEAGRRPLPMQIALWFRTDELADYTPVATAWIYE